MRLAAAVLWCALVLHGWQAYAQGVKIGEEVPHVTDCNFCQKCHVGEKNQARKLLLSSRQLWQAAGQATTSQALTAEMLMISKQESLMRQMLDNCTECYGCNTELMPMNGESKFMNVTYHNEQGASASWLFRATTPVVPSGMAVAKVYCVPVAKRAGGKVAECGSARVLKVMGMYLALEKLSQQCGFEDILPKVWVDKVVGVMPNLGYRISWHGLWMELVDGVSLESLLQKGTPKKLAPQQVLDLMMNRLNKTRVVRAAIFDLLTSQCDRHSQNIFIDEQGQLRLIDNEVALQNSWTNCGFDSIFLPTTQKHNIVRFNNGFVLKQVPASSLPVGEADPQLLLDYRCYLDKGQEELGTNFPPKIKQCLSDISSMTVQQVQEFYGLEELPARNLHTRATDMLTKGFEWAMMYGEPQNAQPKRYLVQPKCCNVTWDGRIYKCGHPYQPLPELPIGDPTTGREWKKLKPDTGSFVGGSRYR